MMLPILFSLILAAHAEPEFRNNFEPNPIRLHSDGVTITRFDCLSWRLAAETNNAQNWKVVPSDCISYVGKYMDAKPIPGKDTQYNTDLEMVTAYAGSHLTTINPTGNGKDIWVFDLDETLLSDLPYYRQPDVQYGGLPFNKTKFHEWIAKGELPGINNVIGLYYAVVTKGFKVVIISGTPEKFRQVRIKNLNNAGVYGWEKLILRKPSERRKTALEYKSDKRTELVKQGYKIFANIGDQWSDLLGQNAGERTFKVPNPMYYVP